MDDSDPTGILNETGYHTVFIITLRRIGFGDLWNTRKQDRRPWDGDACSVPVGLPLLPSVPPLDSEGSGVSRGDLRLG